MAIAVNHHKNPSRANPLPLILLPPRCPHLRIPRQCHPWLRHLVHLWCMIGAATLSGLLLLPLRRHIVLKPVYGHESCAPTTLASASCPSANSMILGVVERGEEDLPLQIGNRPNPSKRPIKTKIRTAIQLERGQYYQLRNRFKQDRPKSDYFIEIPSQ